MANQFSVRLRGIVRRGVLGVGGGGGGGGGGVVGIGGLLRRAGGGLIWIIFGFWFVVSGFLKLMWEVKAGG